VDRYLKPARDKMRIKAISTTKPSPLQRNAISIRTCDSGTGLATLTCSRRNTLAASAWVQGRVGSLIVWWAAQIRS
jgi:hypothetical protein